MNNALLRLDNVKKHFPITKWMLRTKVVNWIKAVDNIDISINAGETYTLVGESGCGKTTTASMILRIYEPTAGSITFNGKDVPKLKGADLKWYRSSVQAVFQNPYSSLNPRMRVNSIIAEPVLANLRLSKGEIKDKVENLLVHVGLPTGVTKLYPHELSGGQRQRVAIARALAPNPKLMVLDEPVSALDVSIRAQIMNLFQELQAEYHMANLLIAHHLGTVRYMSHKMGVMYLGKIVETGITEDLFQHPLHPYTQALLSAALPFSPNMQDMGIVLTGEVPSTINAPTGCHFHPRCYRAQSKCSVEEPQIEEAAPGHWVSCHYYG